MGQGYDPGHDSQKRAHGIARGRFLGEVFRSAGGIPPSCPSRKDGDSEMIRKFSSLLLGSATFVRANDFRTVAGAVLSRDAHPLLQFGKYVICGGIAFATHQIVALALGIHVFPDREYELELRGAAGSGTVGQLRRTVVLTGGGGGNVLALEVFDADGSVVAGGDAPAFGGWTAEFEQLSAIVAPHWKDGGAAIPFKDRAAAIDAVARITGYDPDGERKTHSFINNTLAFAIATVVAYILNVAFVFTPGRHAKHKEILLFIAVSMISYAGGIVAVDFVFRFLGSVESLQGVSRYLSVIANLGFAFTSAMVNYVCRKFIIFQK